MKTNPFAIAVATLLLVSALSAQAGTNSWTWDFENPYSATAASNIELTTYLSGTAAMGNFTNLAKVGTTSMFGRKDTPGNVASNAFSQFSVLYWIYRSDTNNPNGRAFFYRISASSTSAKGSIDSYFSTAQPLVQFLDDSSTWRYLYSGFNVPATNWTHVAMVFDNGAYRWYQNGVMAGTGLVAATYIPASTPATYWQVGAWGFNMLDDFGIFDRALTVDEIDLAMNTRIVNLIPEPGSFTLLGLGAFAFALAHWRRR